MSNFINTLERGKTYDAYDAYERYKEWCEENNATPYVRTFSGFCFTFWCIRSKYFGTLKMTISNDEAYLTVPAL